MGPGTGLLLVKLPEPDVDALVAAGDAEPFAPAGRRFREWAAIPSARDEAWADLLDRALTYVSNLPTQPTTPRKQRSTR